jgi:hypothetical protein
MAEGGVNVLTPVHFLYMLLGIGDLLFLIFPKLEILFFSSSAYPLYLFSLLQPLLCEVHTAGFELLAVCPLVLLFLNPLS